MLRRNPLVLPLVALAAAASASAATAQLVTNLVRASVSSSGQQAFGNSRSPRISANGRCVTFSSFAFNLDPIGTGGLYQAFVRDLTLGVTDLVSEAPGALPGNGDAGFTPPASSGDCRFVAFDSAATNLVPGDTNAKNDIFLRDRQSGATTLVSVGLGGTPANGDSYHPAISSDGGWVVFASLASNLVAGDDNNGSDVFLWNRGTHLITRVTFESQHDQHMRILDEPSISSNGERIAVASLAPFNEVPEENGFWQIWVINRIGLTGTLVSTTGSNGAGDRSSDSPSLSSNGLWVTFRSAALNFAPACAAPLCHGVYRVSVGGGAPQAISPGASDGNAESGGISNLGAWVAFTSYASNLVADDDGQFGDIYLGGPSVVPIVRLSSSRFGGPADGTSQHVSCAADCGHVAFLSYASDLVADDTNVAPDVFVTGVLFTIFNGDFDSGTTDGWEVPDP